MIVTSKKTIYWILYSLLLLFTIYFSFTFISQKIEERKEFEIFKDSWQYVADTNFKQSVEIDPETNEQKVYNEISTPEQLAVMFLNTDSNSLKAEKLSDISTEYKLTKNIDLNGKTWISSDFSEVLDGGSFIISNLKISSSNATVGFILKLTGTVKDLFFSNVNIEYSGDESAEYKMGVVCGESNNGKINNVHIKSGNVCGKIGYNSTKNYIGGLVGFMQGVDSKQNIWNCSNNATIENGLYMGGVVGNIKSSEINNCLNNGEILISASINNGLFVKSYYVYVGGVVGYSLETSIYNSINRGNVNGILEQKLGISPNYVNRYNNSEIMVGGIVGYSSKSIDKCFNTGEIKGGNNYNKTTYVGGIAGKSLNTISNCYNTGNLICKSRPIKNDQSIENTNTEIEKVKVFQSGLFNCWLKIWSGSYKEDNTKDISQYDNKTTYNSFAGGIVGYSQYSVLHSYNIGDITANYDNYSVRKMLTAEIWYDFFMKPIRGSDTIVFNLTAQIPTNVSGINGNRKIDDKNCYANKVFNYSVNVYMDGYLNWTKNKTRKNATYIYDGVDFSNLFGGTTGFAETMSFSRIAYSNNQLKCKGWMKNWAEGSGSTGSLAKERLAIDKNIPLYETKYNKSSKPSASALDSTVWASNPNINNGYPYLKDLYW